MANRAINFTTDGNGNKYSVELRFNRSGETVTVVHGQGQNFVEMQLYHEPIREQVRLALQQYIDDEKIDNSFEFFAHLYPSFYRSIIETAHTMREAKALNMLSKRWRPWFSDYLGRTAGELLTDDSIDEILLATVKDPINEDQLAFDAAQYYEIDHDLLHGKPYFASLYRFRDSNNEIDVIADNMGNVVELHEEEEFNEASSNYSDSTIGDLVHSETKTETDVDFRALADYIKHDKFGTLPTDLSKHLLLPGLSQRIDEGTRATQRAVASLLTSPECSEAFNKAEWTLGDNTAGLWSEYLEQRLPEIREVKLTDHGVTRLAELQTSLNGSNSETDDSIFETLYQLNNHPQQLEVTPLVQSMLDDNLIQYN